MQTYFGNRVQGGAAYGFIVAEDFFEQREKTEGENFEDKTRAEVIGDRLARFFRARAYVDNELGRLAMETRMQIGEREANIFEACRILIKDESISNRVTKDITENNLSPEEAVVTAMDYVADLLRSNNSEYFKSRLEDVADLREMIVYAIRTNCKPKEGRIFRGNAILVADNLSAAQLMRYNLNKVKGIVCRHGSVYSHAAILAKAKNIPMIIDCNLPGDMAIAGFPGVLFADAGRIHISPDETVLSEYHSLRRKKTNLSKDISAIKRSGIDPKKLYSNAVNVDEVRSAKRAGMLGVGLFRSEFLYLERRVPPTEEEQFAIYGEAAAILEGKPLTIRTADFDTDKLPAYINGNEALRGIRFSLTEQKLLRTQLRAILRASVMGRVEILLPVVKAAEDVFETAQLIEELKQELKAEGLPCVERISLGVMIETPEAVDDVERLAEASDFFSIGTNDLSRYALGITREGMKQGDLSGENRDKLLSLIRKTTDEAHKKGIFVMVCGEIGTDPEWYPELIKAGVDGFSVQL